MQGDTPPGGFVPSGPTLAVAFVGWLNGVREARSLAAVEHDPDLDEWARRNNDQQLARGLGHYVLGPARRQNAGTGTYDQVLALWMGSPPHRETLLDPMVRVVGVAGSGGYWTFVGR